MAGRTSSRMRQDTAAKPLPAWSSAMSRSSAPGLFGNPVCKAGEPAHQLRLIEARKLRRQGLFGGGSGGDLGGIALHRRRDVPADISTIVRASMLTHLQ